MTADRQLAARAMELADAFAKAYTTWATCRTNSAAEIAHISSMKDVARADLDAVIRALAAQRAEQAQGAEPVAWIDPEYHVGQPYGKYTSPVTTYEARGWIPLYAHAQPQAAPKQVSNRDGHEDFEEDMK